MRYPNLLLVGVQKAGTTWLHATLARSRHIFGSAPKELNLWGQPNWRDRLEAYQRHFSEAEKPTARYFMESTPHYFHAPTIFGDLAKEIRETIPGVRVMVILRNPIERYRSAYIHHMRKGRLPYTAEIDALTDAQIMLSTGYYGKILAHWRVVFPDIIVLSHDRLSADPAGFVGDIFAALEIECDLDLAQLPSALHTSAQKRAEAGWPATPVLTPKARAALVEHYRHDIDTLAPLVPFDVRPWLGDQNETL